MNNEEHPEWLTEPCPAWCDRKHDDQTLPADRRHHSGYRAVPVIQQRERWQRGRNQTSDDIEADELSIVAFRDIGADETWVAIANDRQWIQVSLESMCRLHSALGQTLAQVTDDATA